MNTSTNSPSLVACGGSVSSLRSDASSNPYFVQRPGRGSSAYYLHELPLALAVGELQLHWRARAKGSDVHLTVAAILDPACDSRCASAPVTPSVADLPSGSSPVASLPDTTPIVVRHPMGAAYDFTVGAFRREVAQGKADMTWLARRADGAEWRPVAVLLGCAAPATAAAAPLSSLAEQPLVSTGATPETAPTSTTPAARNAGADFLIGAVTCLIGIGVTVATYSAVAESGGHYIIAWGAIVYGGMQCFKGLCNLASGS